MRVASLCRHKRHFKCHPYELCRSLACTNIIENMNGTIRQVTHYIRRWRNDINVRRDGGQFPEHLFQVAEMPCERDQW